MNGMDKARFAGVLVDMLRHSGYRDEEIRDLIALMSAHLAAEREDAEVIASLPDPPMN